MNTALWIVQGILAALFLMAGFMKSTTPKEKLALKMPWANDYSAGTIKLIGITQLLAAFGLVIPMLTGIMPVLTPLAATGLCVTMLLAIMYHFRKNEMKAIGTNVVLFLLAAFVIYGRF
jgi:hypothetical protein